MIKQFVIILGIRNSGTSLLCSLLGAAPEINMRWENVDWSFLAPAGKPINGNKLILHEQIRLNERGNTFKTFVNGLNCRLTGRSGPYPYCHRSIMDYARMGAKFILITRSKDRTIYGMTRRGKLSKKRALKIYSHGVKIIHELRIQSTFGKINLIETSYEGLLISPTMEMIKLCRFIGIPNPGEKGAEFNIYNYPEIVKAKLTERMDDAKHK